jgi:hypothetical protein
MANKKFSQFSNVPHTATTFVVGYDGATNVRMSASSVGGWNLVTETTTSRTADNKEFILINNTTCTITLPAPVAQYSISFKPIVVPVSIEIKTNTAGVTIDGVDHSATGLPIVSQWEQISLICDGSNWFIY